MGISVAYRWAYLSGQRTPHAPPGAEAVSYTHLTWASCLQAQAHMKERSDLDLFVENAAEYLTTGNRRVGEGTVVIISSVTGSTEEMVEGVKKARAAGARVLGFIDVETCLLYTSRCV